MYMHSVMTAPRYSRGYTPFISLQRALRSLDEVSGLAVRLDVREDEQAFHVSADLPGVNEKEVEVTFDEGILSISGEKKLSREEKTDTWHMTERSSGSFARKLAISESVDAAKIEAKFDKGVLTVTLPKLAQEKPTAHKIEINAS